MTYVLSDIHGHLQRFESMLEKIDLKSEDSLFILGDVIDRFPYGIEILKKIMDMPNVRMLLGNHEYMMMRALGFPYDGEQDIEGETRASLYKLWYINGGRVTHESWSRTAADLRKAIVKYLRSLPLSFDVEINGSRFKLVHAAPEDMYEEYGDIFTQTKTCFAVWDRDAVFNIPRTEYKLVFGHTPTADFSDSDPMSIWHSGGLIGIDCGCGISGESCFMPRGRLGCLCLDNMKEFYSE